MNSDEPVGPPDPIAIDRLVHGWQHRYSRTELHSAYERLNRRGLSARVIAQQIGVTQRSVHRWRAQDRQRGAQ